MDQIRIDLKMNYISEALENNMNQYEYKRVSFGQKEEINSDDACERIVPSNDRCWQHPYTKTKFYLVLIQESDADTNSHQVNIRAVM